MLENNETTNTRDRHEKGPPMPPVQIPLVRIATNAQIQTWLDQRGDPNKRDDLGEVLLQCPALDMPTAKNLIERGAILDPEWFSGDPERRPDLMFGKRNAETIEYLAGLGVNHSLPGIAGVRDTAIEEAVRRDFKNAIRALIRVGTDVDLPGPKGHTPLAHAKRMSTARLLILNGADPNRRSDLGTIAWWHAHTRISRRTPRNRCDNLRWFLDHGVDMHATIRWFPDPGIRPSDPDKNNLPLWALLNTPEEAETLLAHPSFQDVSAWLNPDTIREIKDPDIRRIYETRLVLAGVNAAHRNGQDAGGKPPIGNAEPIALGYGEKTQQTQNRSHGIRSAKPGQGP